MNPSIWLAMQFLKGQGTIVTDPTFIPELLAGDFTPDLLTSDHTPNLLATDNFTPELLARD